MSMRCLVEKYRVAGQSDWGPVGAFSIPAGVHRPFALYVIASDGDGWAEHGYPFPAWEHVSVSTKVRCPTWEEMCYVKNLFFGKDEWVLQYHPAESDYKNCHPYCLHIWRPQKMEIPKPNSIMVAA